MLRNMNSIYKNKRESSLK